ncbi:MAG TPA: transposase [Nonomuraea sp.]|nr:transposase [Nonomuraea sp.]
MRLWVGPDGLEIEGKILQGRQLLTVHRWYGKRRIWVADCRSVDQVREHVDLTDLVEVMRLPTRPKQHR